MYGVSSKTVSKRVASWRKDVSQFRTHYADEGGGHMRCPAVMALKVGAWLRGIGADQIGDKDPVTGHVTFNFSNKKKLYTCMVQMHNMSPFLGSEIPSLRTFYRVRSQLAGLGFK